MAQQTENELITLSCHQMIDHHHFANRAAGLLVMHAAGRLVIDAGMFPAAGRLVMAAGMFPAGRLPASRDVVDDDDDDDGGVAAAACDDAAIALVEVDAEATAFAFA